MVSSSFLFEWIVYCIVNSRYTAVWFVRRRLATGWHSLFLSVRYPNTWTHSTCSEPLQIPRDLSFLQHEELLARSKSLLFFRISDIGRANRITTFPRTCLHACFPPWNLQVFHNCSSSAGQEVLIFVWTNDWINEWMEAWIRVELTE